MKDSPLLFGYEDLALEGICGAFPHEDLATDGAEEELECLSIDAWEANGGAGMTTTSLSTMGAAVESLNHGAGLVRNVF